MSFPGGCAVPTPRRPAPRPQRSGRPESAEIFICLVSWQDSWSGGTLNGPTVLWLMVVGKTHPANKRWNHPSKMG